MTKFTTKSLDGQNPQIHEKKDLASPGVPFSPGNAPASLVEVLPDPAEDADWVRVRRRIMGSSLEGWMRRGHLGSAADAPVPAPVPVEDFVWACIVVELSATEGSDPAHAVLADYLIALAWIETQLDPAKFQTPGSDKVGPYKLSAKEWDEFAAAQGLTADDRFAALNQIPVAAAIARRDWAAFSKLARPDGETASDGPFVPNFLNLFHAWLVGVPAAVEVDQINRGENQNVPIRPIVEKHHSEPGAVDALMEARAQFFKPRGRDAAVADFVDRTTEALTEAFVEAGKLLVKHFPEFVLPPGSGTSAPWMEIAERQLKIWEDDHLIENSGQGAELVKGYLDAAGHHGAQVAWCGAFIAFCLKESGNNRAMASIIRTPLRAADWKTWGDTELRASIVAGQLRRGAVVVISPGEDTGPSGHVTFLSGGEAPPNMVSCLGGNQGKGLVKLSNFAISRIAAVRWLEVGSPAGELVQGDFGISFEQKAANIVSNLMKDLDFKDFQAAGLVGNLAFESGRFKQLQEISPLVAGSRGGFGWAQWTGTRRVAFERFAGERGLKTNSDAANYGFLKHELTTSSFSGFAEKLRRTNSLAEATQLTHRRYEIPSDTLGSNPTFRSFPDRLQLANEALTAHQNQA